MTGRIWEIFSTACARNGPDHGLKISSMTGQIGRLDYIRPMENVMDLRDVREEEWLRLFGMIAEKCAYEAVILDLGDGIDGLYEILERCSRVYTPYISDPVALAKLKQYEDNLREAGHENILRHTVKKLMRRRTAHWKETAADMAKTEELYGRLMCRLDMTKDTGEDELQDIILQVLDEAAKEEYLPLSEKIRISRELFNSFRRLDILQDLLEDEAVTEIMVNRTESIFYEKGGRLYRSDRRFISEERLNDVIQQIAGEANRYVNEASPIADARLPDGSRVNVF